MDTGGLPAFASIAPEHVKPAVRQTLESQRQRLMRLEKSPSPGFHCIEKLESIQDTVHRLWGTVSHLNAVASTPELRNAHNDCLPMITEFGTDVSQNQAIYRLFSEVQARIDPEARTRRQLLANGLRDFRLAGVARTPLRPFGNEVTLTGPRPIDSAAAFLPGAAAGTRWSSSRRFGGGDPVLNRCCASPASTRESKAHREDRNLERQ